MRRSYNSLLFCSFESKYVTLQHVQSTNYFMSFCVILCHSVSFYDNICHSMVYYVILFRSMSLYVIVQSSFNTMYYKCHSLSYYIYFLLICDLCHHVLLCHFLSFYSLFLFSLVQATLIHFVPYNFSAEIRYNITFRKYFGKK